MSIYTTLVVRRVATGVARASVGFNAAAFIIDVIRAQYHLAILPLGMLGVVLAFLSVKDAMECWVDSKAGKAIADRSVSELTLKAVEDCVRRREYRVDVHGERTSVN